MFGRFRFDSKRRQLEHRLLAEFEQAIDGLGAPNKQARRLGRQILEAAKKEANRTGRQADLYREGDGDKHLSDAASNPELQSLLDRLGNQGVTTEDFRWWHNLSLLEKLYLREQDNTAILAEFRKHKSRGASDAEATKTIKAHWPLYAWNIEEIDEADPHAKVPIELKARVNAYRLQRLITDPEEFRSELERIGSFNAHIREQIAREAL